MWLTGDRDQGPVPMGVSVADMLAGHTIVQAVLAALVRRGRTGQGCQVETSLLEVLVDMQFEALTTFMASKRPPCRSSLHNANAYLPAPYGVYPTADGHLAIAMTPIAKLQLLLDIPELARFASVPADAFAHRDEIKLILAARLACQPTAHWLALLEPADIWCAEVLDWPRLLQSSGFLSLEMLQDIAGANRKSFATTRVPIRVDGDRPASSRGAPTIGEHTQAIIREFSL
jgi:crotonobetainyl-CoA:carnitine CoA-transferase CaiB-like acyl-CoA transferase